jgi:hypothetical protein
MTHRYKFIYPYDLVVQLGFDGRNFSSQTYPEPGHIIDEDKHILCGRDRDDLEVDHDGTIIRPTAITPRVCKNCEAIWKSLPDSPWKRWTEIP